MSARSLERHHATRAVVPKLSSLSPLVRSSASSSCERLKMLSQIFKLFPNLSLAASEAWCSVCRRRSSCVARRTPSTAAATVAAAAPRRSLADNKTFEMVLIA